MANESVALKPFSPDKALAMMLEQDLTHPPYYKVLEVKKNCYPAKNSMTIINTIAKIKLQCLLDHTSRRLVQGLIFADVINLKIYYKWGFDASTGVVNTSRHMTVMNQQISMTIAFSLLRLSQIRIMNDAEIILEKCNN